MTPGTVFSVHALIAIGLAIPLLAVPEDVLALYGMQPDAAARYMTRLVGASLVAIAALTWLAREAREGPALDALCGGLAIGNLAGLLVALLHQLTDPEINALGWSTVAIYACLFVAYAALWHGRAARSASAGVQDG
jgi:hypothetical protein